ncbi:MAG: amidohydrolase [Candidatus Hodarchaeales archaeon]|jgi:predicted amidohydrolase YtcJ
MTLGQPDTVIYNGNIVTFDDKNTTAQMIAITDGKFSYVGDHDEELIKKSNRSINLEGKTILPGFIDLHTHLWTEANIIDVDLGGIKTREDTLKKVEKTVISKKPHEWVFLSGWDESFWTDKKEFPTLIELDRISKINPIYMKREDGHLVVVNSLALEQLSIPTEHKGVMKDKDGLPTGVLKDVWLDLTPYYQKLIPRSIKASCEIAASVGITAVVDNLTITPEGQKNILKEYFELDLKNELPIRIFLNPTRDLMKKYVEEGVKRNQGTDKLRFSGYKGFFDGAIGSHTAMLSFEYVDVGNRGDKFLDEAELVSQIKFAEENECTICIHAIGDQAIEKLLDCFEEGMRRARNAVTMNKHRIEHAEMINDVQIGRAKKLGLILSMQPNFLKWQYPGELYEQRLGGDKICSLNRFNRILRLGAHLSFGSDNMPLSPLYGIRQSVTFPSKDTQISVKEAIRAYTINNAVSLSVEHELGNIVEGKFADFIILDKSPFALDSTRIEEINVVKTYVQGLCVYNGELNSTK